MELKELNSKISSAEKQLDVMKMRRDVLNETFLRNEIELNGINLEELEQASIFLHKLSEKQRMAACSRLEDLCTVALQYAVGNTSEIQINLDRKRGKPAADLVVHNIQTDLVSDPIEGKGGGIVDIVSVALRFIVAEVWDGGVDGTIFLDEAYKHLSKEYVPFIAEFLRKLRDEFDRQIILSTHNDFLAMTADTRINVSIENSESNIVVTNNEE